jgi:hypothetical protein
MRVEMWAFKSVTWPVTFTVYGTVKPISQRSRFNILLTKEKFPFDGRKCNFKGTQLDVEGKSFFPSLFKDVLSTPYHRMGEYV